MSVRKIFYEAIGEALPQNFSGITSFGNAILSNFLERIKTKITPDRVVEISDLIGRPRMVAIKDIPYELPNAWGMKITTDIVVAEYGELVGYAGSGLGAFSFEHLPEYYMDKTFGFFMITQEEYELADDLIQQFFDTDVDDVKGVVFGAMYVCNCKIDTPSKAFNEKVIALRHREIEDKKNTAKRIQTAKETAKERIVKSLDEIRDKRLSYRFDDDRLLITIDGNTKVFVMDFFHYTFDFHTISSYIHDTLSHIDDLKIKKNLILTRKMPLITIRVRGGTTYDYYLDGNAIYIPKAVFGHIIGKGGKTIKRISKVLGKRISIKELSGKTIGGIKKVMIAL